MGISCMVLGNSGVGKSTSIENLDADKTLIIKAISKPLPFRGGKFKNWDKETNTGNIISTDNPAMIQAIIKGAKSKGKTIIVVDDVQYIMANEFMRRVDESGWNKFSEIGRNMWSLFNTANEECDEDVRVYFLSHTEESESGTVKMKTIGKMLDNAITLEGMVTVVLRALKTTDKYYFSTQNNGRDTCKSPKGMFDELEIPNDLAYVDDKICSYYDIKETKTKKENK